MNRRGFLKLCSLAAKGLVFGFGTTACTTFPKDISWVEVPDNEFSISRFNDWFNKYKLYNYRNPNLKLLHTSGNRQTFSMHIHQFAGIPGINYSSEKMFAVADGFVDKIGENNVGLTHTVGGYRIDVIHPDNLNSNYFRGRVFGSSYDCLGNLYVKIGDKVTRGQLLADVSYRYQTFAKLKFQRNRNWIDPDNYGVKHEYMNYWNGKTDFEVSDMAAKAFKQRKIISEISEYLIPALNLNISTLLTKEHRTFQKNRACFWDDVEIMRYLDELYNARPQYFQSLPQDKFFEMKKEFYANQPIILTLPLSA